MKGLQEMCQQFQIIINELDDKIKMLEKSNRILEIENETLSYKVWVFLFFHIKGIKFFKNKCS